MIKDFIRTNGQLIIYAEGSSMNPTIKDGEKVVIEKYKEKPEIGDIVLYKSSNDIKLHRITEVKGNETYTVKGDGESSFEDIHITDIWGKVTQESREEKYSGIVSKCIGQTMMDLVIEENELQEIRIHE